MTLSNSIIKILLIFAATGAVLEIKVYGFKSKVKKLTYQISYALSIETLFLYRTTELPHVGREFGCSHPNEPNGYLSSLKLE